MDSDDLKANQQKMIEKADRILRLSQYPEWKDFIDILSQMLKQEIGALSGMTLGNKYYKRIGFDQVMAFIDVMPGIMKDKQKAEALLHQGRAKGLETIIGIPAHFAKQKKLARERLETLVDHNITELEKQRFIEESYKQS